MCHMNGCFEMYCLCSRRVELSLTEHTQHTTSNIIIPIKLNDESKFPIKQLPV